MKYSRRSILKSGAAALGASLLPLGCSSSGPRPNFVIISVDSLNPFHLGCYGYRRNTSPRLDKLAKKSLVFENAISPSGWTPPSYASLISGQYVPSHGIYEGDQRLRAEGPLIQRALGEMGYSTACFIVRGFLHSIALDQQFEHFDLGRRYQPQRYRKASRWIRDHKDKPFFLFFYTNDVHRPYNAESPYDEEFVGDKFYAEDNKFSMPLADRDMSKADVPVRSADQMLMTKHHMKFTDGNDQVGYWIARYDGTIKYTDYYIGQILDTLEEEGLMENTVVMINADHGESMYQHDWFFTHFVFYENVERVPFIMYMPGMQPKRIRGQVQLEDTAPTMLAMCQREPMAGMEGVNLLPLLDGTSNEVRENTFAMGRFWSMIRGRVDGRMYKCIFQQGTRQKLEKPWLFDLDSDPEEKKNIFQKQPEVVKILTERFDEWANERDWARGEVERTGFDKETLDELRTLGYIGDG